MSFFDTLSQDARHAVRALRRRPGFSAMAILVLACGIGATTASFTQIHAVLYRDLPVRDPDQLRAFSYRDPRRPTPLLTVGRAEYLEMRDANRSFSELACWSTGSMQPLGERGPILVQFVSANYFRTLGVEAALGRTFFAGDDRTAAAPVAVISDRVWRRDYGGDARVLGRSLRIQRTAFTIVGVLPAGFYGLDPTAAHDVMLPHALVPLIRPGNPACQIVGRLRDGISSEQARAEMQRLFRESPLAPSNQPRDEMDVALSPVEPGGGPAGLRQRTAPSLRLLMVTTTLVLLVACANVAGLLLAHATTRTREIGTALALGATRARIVRRLLAESVLLAAIAGMAGVGLAYALNPWLPRLVVELGGVATLNGVANPLGMEVAPDGRVLAFSAAITMLTAIVFGVVPALRASRVDVVAMIRQAPRGAGHRSLAGGGTFAALQIAFSMMLVVGVGLSARTLANLADVPVGYQPDGLLFATLNPIDRPRAFVDDAVRKMQELPGVVSIAASQWPLFNNAEPKLPVCVDGDARREMTLDIEWATPGFFATWGVPFVGGTDFAGAAAGQAVVNRTFADRVFRGRSAVGQTIGIGQCPGRQTTIVGVVADHLDRQRVAVAPMVYLPYPAARAFNPTTIALRVRGEPHALIPAVRAVIASLDSSLTDGDVTTGIEYRDAHLRRERTLTSLLSAFGVLAVLMSCLGIYATVSHVATARTRELGIRAALGAARPALLHAVVGRLSVFIGVGIATGLVAAMMLSAYVESLLFGVSRFDAWTLATAALVIAVAGGVAAMRPALRAVRTNPVEALRTE